MEIHFSQVVDMGNHLFVAKPIEPISNIQLHNKLFFSLVDKENNSWWSGEIDGNVLRLRPFHRLSYYPPIDINKTYLAIPVKLVTREPEYEPQGLFDLLTHQGKCEETRIAQEEASKKCWACGYIYSDELLDWLEHELTCEEKAKLTRMRAEQHYNQMVARAVTLRADIAKRKLDFYNAYDNLPEHKDKISIAYLIHGK